MSDPENTERTTGGLVGKLAGKAKDIAGRVTGDDDLAREGRLQSAAADADVAARQHAGEAKRSEQAAELAGEKAAIGEERDRLRTEVAADEREAQIEADRRAAEGRAETQAAQERSAASEAQQTESAAADAREDASQQKRIASEQDAAKLADEARASEARADVLDPDKD